MLARCSGLRASGFAVLIVATAVPATAQSTLDRYEAALAAYRDGRYAEAVVAVAAFSQRDLETLRGYWFERTGDSARPNVDTSPRRLRIAGMLHLEAAFISRPEPQLATTGPWLDRRRIQRAPRPSAPGASHLSLGLGLVSLVARHGAPPEAFVRRWYLAAAMHFHSHAQRVLARYVLTKALVSFPDDGPLLLESGAVAESEATAGAPEYYWGLMDGLVRAQAERRAALAFAEGELRHALAADGSLVEARVRLGRVLAEAGREDEAARELETALSDEPTPYLVYLARLFLGVVHERAGRLDDAVAGYRGAIDAYPLSQAARTALAHAFHRLGDHEAAFEAVRASLALGFEGGQADPWWAYGLSQLRPFDVLIDGLREEARQ